MIVGLSPRIRQVLVPVLGAMATVLVCATAARAATITPTGIGDLLPSPQLVPAHGQGTMYETYHDPMLWLLDEDYGVLDVMDPIVEILADVLMALVAVIGAAAVVVTQWLFSVVTLPPLENAIASSVSGAAKGLMMTLLPTSVVVGGLVAFGRLRKGNALSQIAWMVAAGVFAVSLLTAPRAWVGGIDDVRQIGSTVALDSAAAGIGSETNMPFDLGHTPTYTDNTRDNMLREGSDAVWRTYVATPWCLAEFGSLDACKQYGKGVLDQGIDADARKHYIQGHITTQSVGDASAKWVQGHDPLGRIMITAPALISVVLFCGLVLLLAFSSLASLLGAMMLLVAGVVFACMWIIPGRPRSWGVQWFEVLFGQVMQSFISTMVLGCVLVLNTACTSMFPLYGWLPCTGLSITAAITAFRYRRIMESILGIKNQMSPGGALLAYMVGRGALRAAGKLGKGLGGLFGRGVSGFGGGGGRPSGGRTVATGGGQGPSGGAGPAGAGIPRRPLPSPAPRSAAQLPPGTPQQQGALPGTSVPAQVTAAPAPAGRPHELQGAPQRHQVAAGQQPRAALPAGTGHSASSGQAAPDSTTARTSPVIRESGGSPNYRFRPVVPRQGQRPARVVRGEVLSRTTTTRPAPGPRPSTARPAPAAKTARPRTGTTAGRGQG